MRSTQTSCGKEAWRFWFWRLERTIKQLAPSPCTGLTCLMKQWDFHSDHSHLILCDQRAAHENGDRITGRRIARFTRRERARLHDLR